MSKGCPFLSLDDITVHHGCPDQWRLYVYKLSLLTHRLWSCCCWIRNCEQAAGSNPCSPTKIPHITEMKLTKSRQVPTIIKSLRTAKRNGVLGHLAFTVSFHWTKLLLMAPTVDPPLGGTPRFAIRPKDHPLQGGKCLAGWE